MTSQRGQIRLTGPVEGERDITEHVLEHLSGYRGARPVRVGNAAWQQEQLAVFGEVLDAALVLRDSLGQFEEPVQTMLLTLAELAGRRWAEPDAGMWEARDERRRRRSSKPGLGAAVLSPCFRTMSSGSATLNVVASQPRIRPRGASAS